MEKRTSRVLTYDNQSHPASLSGTYSLAGARLDRYDSFEVDAKRLFANGYTVFVSYARSSARTNAALNYQLAPSPLGTQQSGPLPWDTPNRLISWGWLPLELPKLKKNWDFVYTVDWHSGLTMKCLLSVLTVGSVWLGAIVSTASADDVLTPLDLRQVKVGGEIGRRIDVTVNNNLLVLECREGFPRALSCKTARRRLYRSGQTDRRGRSLRRLYQQRKGDRPEETSRRGDDQDAGARRLYRHHAAARPACGACGTFTRWATSSSH